jgi:hypothetical protein
MMFMGYNGMKEGEQWIILGYSTSLQNCDSMD